MPEPRLGAGWQQLLSGGWGGKAEWNWGARGLSIRPQKQGVGGRQDCMGAMAPSSPFLVHIVSLNFIYKRNYEDKIIMNFNMATVQP